MVFNCSICDYQTELKFNYQKHLKTKKHFSNLKKEEESMKKEEENMKKEEKSMILKDNNTIDNPTLKCLWCRRIFNRRDNLIRHNTHCKFKKKNISLEKSQKVFKYIENNTKDKYNSICRFCNLILANPSNLNRHYKSCQIFKYEKNKLELENYIKKEIKEDVSKKIFEHIDNISTTSIIDDLKCQFCQNNYSCKSSLNRHLKSCFNRLNKMTKLEQEKNLEIEKLKKIENDKNHQIEKLQLVIEKEHAINEEKDKTIEVAKQSKIININNNNNKTINFLNTNFGDMIAMEQFLTNLEQTEKLTLQERENLLSSYQECGIDVFARNFSYVMKQNCKRQLENQGIKDMKLLPLFCSDGNLRSHKEKLVGGWKTHYDNHSINRMLNISNDQIHQSYQQIIPVSGRERSKIYNEIKKDNHQNKFLELQNKTI